jgi:hypothetical protein
MFERFKKKWNIESNFQLVVILIVFAITGTSTLYVRKGIFFLLGITDETQLWLRITLYILIIFPAYNVMLLIVGFLFGQFKFAWEFEKKMFNGIFNRKGKRVIETETQKIAE